MAIYLKRFENHTQYDNYINGSDAILPNVSICTTEGDVHYNPSTPPTPVETRVVAKFNVTDTSSPTPIGYNQYTSGFSEIEIDGVVQPSVVSAYTFSTTGEHTVKYTLTDPTSISTRAFYQCTSLTSIVIPSGVTSIGHYAFYKCSSLTSVTIPDSVTSIGGSVFCNCSSLTSIGPTGSGASVEIPSGVTIIGYNTFDSCSGLTSIDIPNSVTTILDNAFDECSGLTSCTIGSSVTSIGERAFAACRRLTSITVEATTPPSLSNSNAFSYTNNCPIYVPSGSVGAYKAASGWSSYASRIQAIP